MSTLFKTCSQLANNICFFFQISIITIYIFDDVEGTIEDVKKKAKNVFISNL